MKKVDALPLIFGELPEQELVIYTGGDWKKILIDSLMYGNGPAVAPWLFKK